MSKTVQGCDVKTTKAVCQEATVLKPGLDAWKRYRAERAAEVRLRRKSQCSPAPYLQTALQERQAQVLQQRNELVEANLPVLVHVAERLGMKLPSFVEKEELVQAGVPALIRSVERFRPSRGFRFETFAVPRLRGAILDALRSNDDVPRLARQRSRILIEAEESFRKSEGRPPSQEELTEAISVRDPSERDRILKEKPIPAVLSTEAAIASGSGRGELNSLGQALPDSRARNPMTEAERKDLKRYLTEHLPPRERLIIILYYLENMTMLEVATTLGISESRVSQTLKPLLEKIRAKVNHRRSELT